MTRLPSWEILQRAFQRSYWRISWLTSATFCSSISQTGELSKPSPSSSSTSNATLRARWYRINSRSRFWAWRRTAGSSTCFSTLRTKMDQTPSLLSCWIKERKWHMLPFAVRNVSSSGQCFKRSSRILQPSSKRYASATPRFPSTSLLVNAKMRCQMRPWYSSCSAQFLTNAHFDFSTPTLSWMSLLRSTRKNRYHQRYLHHSVCLSGRHLQITRLLPTTSSFSSCCSMQSTRARLTIKTKRNAWSMKSLWSS